MLNFISSMNIYSLFYDTKDLDRKCFIALGVSGFCCLTIVLSAILLKIKFVDFLNALFIIDSILLSQIVTTVAFVGMMRYLDRNKWQMKVIEATFGFGVISYGISVRMLLLHMKWVKWRVLTYKLSLFFSALTYFGIGIYCFYTNYSFTFNILKFFDKQCRYFVLLYVFASFELLCKLVKTMGNFDYTDKLKYDFVIKNVTHQRIEKHLQIKKSLKTIQIK